MELGQDLLHRWSFTIAVLHLRIPLPETDRKLLKKWQHFINL